MAKNLDTSRHVWALARISLGFIFFWAFIDKLFGLGYATCRNATTNIVDVSCSQAWINGGSPTTGFLSHATKGPFSDFYQNLAGQAWVDWLFMSGLLLIGVGLILGIGIRLSVFFGTVMMVLMWSAALWPENNPIIDDHIIYIFMLFGILAVNQNQAWGLRKWWLKQKIVKRFQILE